MNLLVRLGLAVHTESGIEITGQRKKPLTSDEIKRLDVHYNNFIELCSLRYNGEFQSHPSGIKLSYTDGKSNTIAKWFNSANIPGACCDATCLFTELKDDEYSNFFVPWDLQFTSQIIKSKKVKSNNGDAFSVMEATDKGKTPKIVHETGYL
jgi:hypothetical protein